ncbi:MAG: polyprenol monophosphomannose synthase [Candidatus Njordarchaeum guaymaensis]
MNDTHATDISLVIPTYNERENLPLLIKRISNALKDINYEVIIVDDNSPDGTWRLAEELSKEFPIRVLRREGKKGLSSAVMDGIAIANSEKVIVMDADLQHPPEILPLILKALENNDLVVASRYVPGGGVENWSAFRKLVSFGAKVLAYMIFPKVRKVKDPLSGFFGLRKSQIDLSKLNPLGFKILLEILVKGKFDKTVEVPYIFHGRLHGKSKMGSKEIKNYIIHVIRLSRETGGFWRILLLFTLGAILLIALVLYLIVLSGIILGI